MSKTAIRTFEATIEGQRMLMHNGQLADPLNEHTKALKVLTSQRKKGDEDHLRIAEVEFQGSLWWSPDLGPAIPGETVERMIQEGAMKSKLGKQFKAALVACDDWFALEYDGPRTREGLWKDKRFVDRRTAKVNRAAIVRTRPLFRNWKLSFSVQLLDGALNDSDLKKAIVDAGTHVGIGDWRPRFGTFSVADFRKVST